MLGLWAHGGWAGAVFWDTNTLRMVQKADQELLRERPGHLGRSHFQIQWQGGTMGVFLKKPDQTLENKLGEGKQFRWGGGAGGKDQSPGVLHWEEAVPSWIPTHTTYPVSLENKPPQNLGAHYVRGQPCVSAEKPPQKKTLIDRSKQIADLFADALGPLVLEPPASND